MAGNLISDAGIQRIQQMSRDLNGLLLSPDPAAPHQAMQGSKWFMARITGWSPIIANARWKYAWEEVVLKADDDVAVSIPPGRVGTTSGDYYALNLIEVNNITHHTGTQGNSVNQLPPYPVNFNLLPVGGGSGGVVANRVIVMMYVITDADGFACPVFQYQNADFGSCT